MLCSSCGTALAATAKFCHKCGARVDAVPPPVTQPSPLPGAGWQVGLPWGVGGTGIGVLLTLLILRVGGQRVDAAGGGAAEGGGSETAQGAAPRSILPAPDISQMSPEERARRLFDRVMALAEAGKRDSVQFFFPMALGAYQQLPARDLDAHYDIGLLDLAAGEPAGALAQADTILSQVPTHLYGFVLRGQAYEQQTNRQGARRAYADFLRHETTERSRQRPEYAEHARTLDAFHTAAVRAVGSSK